MEQVEEIRMNKNEFRELIPHLQLEDLFLIEIKKHKWIHMFEGVRLHDDEEIRCNLCSSRPTLTFMQFEAHLKTQLHKDAIKKVDQFYHPFYTYAKDEKSSAERSLVSTIDPIQLNTAKRLAELVKKRGQQQVVYLLLNDIMNIRCYNEKKKFPLIMQGTTTLLRCVLCLENLNVDLDEHLRSPHHSRNLLYTNVKLSLSNHPEINKYVLIQTLPQSEYEDFERILLDMLLKEEPKAPHMIRLVWEMPYDELFKIEYFTGKTWTIMLIKISEQPLLLRCNMCSKYCDQGGLQGHLLGKQHKKMQLILNGMRHKTNPQVTKYTAISVGPKMKLHISLKARKRLTPNVEMRMRELKEGLHITEFDKETSDGESSDVEVFEDFPALQEAQTKNNKADAAANTTNSNIESDSGLIGVEYVVKILAYPNDRKPMFECCLCEHLANEFSMQDHLTSYNHRYKYCELHYSNAFKKYLSLFSEVKRYDLFRVMSPVLAKIANDIEEYHGRSLPRVVLESEFKKRRSEIIAELYCAKHASQLYGPSYINVFSEKAIKKIIARKDFYKAPLERSKHSSNRFVAPTKRPMLYCGARVHTQKEFIVEDRSLKEKAVTKKNVTMRSLNFRIKSKVDKRLKRMSDQYHVVQKTIWQQYRQQISTTACEIERDYKNYRNNPESHPQYDFEWNQFWKRRKAELNDQGIDHRSYDFQPDWVNFFQNRMEQLFSEALKQAETSIRMRLNIPIDAEEYIDTFDDNLKPYSTRVHELTGEGNPCSVQQDEQHSMGDQIIEPAQKKQKVDTDSLVMQWNLQAYSRARGDDKSIERLPECKVSNLERVNPEARPDVIHVLRLMTAFEDYLGSLGQKITDLLFKTLSLDKNLPRNLLEEKVLTATNCSLLETAMEKMKGILFADLLESSKHPGFNQVIMHTEDLLKYADNMGYRTDMTAIQWKQNSEDEFSRGMDDSNFQELIHFTNYGRNNKYESNVFHEDSSIIEENGNAPGGNSERHNELGGLNSNLKRQNDSINPFSSAGEILKRIPINRHQSLIDKDDTNDFRGQFKTLNARNKFSEIGHMGNKRGNPDFAKIINISSVGGNNFNNLNPNNNYQDISNRNSSNKGNQYDGVSRNWEKHSSNTVQNINSRLSKTQSRLNGPISTLQQQNLKQLQFLRQQQQQRHLPKK